MVQRLVDNFDWEEFETGNRPIQPGFSGQARRLTNQEFQQLSVRLRRSEDVDQVIAEELPGILRASDPLPDFKETRVNKVDDSSHFWLENQQLLDGLDFHQQKYLFDICEYLESKLSLRSVQLLEVMEAVKSGVHRESFWSDHKRLAADLIRIDNPGLFAETWKMYAKVGLKGAQAFARLYLDDEVKTDLLPLLIDLILANKLDVLAVLLKKLIVVKDDVGLLQLLIAWENMPGERIEKDPLYLALLEARNKRYLPQFKAVLAAEIDGMTSCKTVLAAINLICTDDSLDIAFGYEDRSELAEVEEQRLVQFADDLLQGERLEEAQNLAEFFNAELKKKLGWQDEVVTGAETEEKSAVQQRFFPRVKM